MSALDGCVDKDEIRAEVLVEVVGVRWCASQRAEEVAHSLALHARQIQIRAISLSDRLLHKCRPNLDRATDFLALHEEQVLLAHRHLHRHEVIHNHVPPNPISADVHRVYPVLVCLLLSKQLQNHRGIFSQDRQRAVKVRVGVFALGDVSGLAGVDDVDVVVIDAG